MEFTLPHEMAVEIVGSVAASSLRPMDNLSSLRASCKAFHAACREGAVGRRVAHERKMWRLMFGHEGVRFYSDLKERLAIIGNPGACYEKRLELVFVYGRAQLGAQRLARAATAGHMRAFYILALLRYDADRRACNTVEYIRQVEGKIDVGENVIGSVTIKKTNTECRRCQYQDLNNVQNVAWRLICRPPRSAPVALPNKGDWCTVAGCSKQGWSGCCDFCSDD